MPDSEVRGTWRSLCAATEHVGASTGISKAGSGNRPHGGARAALIGELRSGEVRRAGTPLEHDRAPWDDSRRQLGRTWYRHFRGAKTDGENRWAKPIGEG